MTSPASPTTAARTCPACGEPGSGRFCSACGASLGAASCAGCDATLAPGARYCHRCGLAAGAPAPGSRAARDRSSIAPWAIAFVALLALAANFAGRNFASARGSTVDGSANALPQASLGEAPAESPASGGRPPSLANMSPREIADRLFDRVMLMQSQGKTDSAAFFATMALQNYTGMGDLDLDQRYDMGRVAEVAGRADVARAQADTILQRDPTHLLGLVLATRAAAAARDAKALGEFRARLLAAARSGERARGLDEYKRHAAEIDEAIKAAQGAK